MSFEKDSEIIDNLDINTEIIIIGEARYYYKVKYADAEGNERIGYIAKRNSILNENLIEK